MWPKGSRCEPAPAVGSGSIVLCSGKGKMENPSSRGAPQRVAVDFFTVWGQYLEGGGSRILWEWEKPPGAIGAPCSFA